MFGRIRPEKAQTVDVFSTRILRYDNDGMPFAEQYFIDQQTPCSPVAISEGMQIFKIGMKARTQSYQMQLPFVYCTLRRFKQSRHLSH